MYSKTDHDQFQRVKRTNTHCGLSLVFLQIMGGHRAVAETPHDSVKSIQKLVNQENLKALMSGGCVEKPFQC